MIMSQSYLYITLTLLKKYVLCTNHISCLGINKECHVSIIISLFAIVMEIVQLIISKSEKLIDQNFTKNAHGGGV